MSVSINWIQHFSQLGYKSVAYEPIVHEIFPTTFNMSVGVVQMDPMIRSSKHMSPIKEVLVQPCVRHFDIEKVGDESHLSFFEMAGAFEVVDYNKLDTVNHTWEFLTQELKINPAKLWASVFNKDEVAGRVIDLEAELKDFVAKTLQGRVAFGDKTTNLWEQGGGADLKDNIKLCGPQVEFFYDQGESGACTNPNCGPFCRCGRFLEISNILFIEHFIDYTKEPVLGDLVNKSTETVIGVERCAKIIEGVDSVYLTSYFKPLLDLVAKDGQINQNIKIILDHIKSLLFILSEERIEPSKKDRGRIIRTLIRNLLASLYAEGLDGKGLLPKLCQTVAEMYAKPYPHLVDGIDTCLAVIFDHEREYKVSLEKGARKIAKIVKAKGLENLTEQDYTAFWEIHGFPKKLLPVYGIS